MHGLREVSPAARDGAAPPSMPRIEVTAVNHLTQPDPRLTMAHDPTHPRCERVRALRTELLLRREPFDRTDIVALLSPCACEGRSLLAADLAIAFAQTGRSTLLVDADLRHPQQHVYFGTDNRQGLSQAIEQGTVPQLQTVRSVPRLAMLAAGVLPSNPLELLSSRAFALMVEGWREQFQFVVIDTPPVKQYSDGLAVASLVGRVLALSRAQHTPYRDLQDMLRRLAATRSQVLGAVISHF
jgi:receptor protein-tyrosine kinase